MIDPPPAAAALRKRQMELEDRGRVLGEQSWQLAAAPFSLAVLLPVFLDAPWRLGSFALGMTLAVTLWGYFQIRSRLCWGEAAKIAGELERSDSLRPSSG